jgi:hypothetical protein
MPPSRYAFVLAGTTALLAAQTPQFAPPFRAEAAGAPINVTIGHAAPLWRDVDGDGLADLLVGQFGEGKLRIYKNHGTKTEPLFKDFVFAKAGGADATVPAG